MRTHTITLQCNCQPVVPYELRVAVELYDPANPAIANRDIESYPIARSDSAGPVYSGIALLAENLADMCRDTAPADSMQVNRIMFSIYTEDADGYAVHVADFEDYLSASHAFKTLTGMKV